MNGRRSVNLVSIWIVVIFTVIAVTLVSIFMLVYTSTLNQELRYTLREKITVLSDNADRQVMEPIRSEAVRRLAMKDGFSQVLRNCAGGKGGSLDIRRLAAWCAEVNAAIPQSSNVDIFFPKQSMVVGSEGVRFMKDKKYTMHASDHAFLSHLAPEDTSWLRTEMHEDGQEVPYIVYVRPCPGVFSQDSLPVIAVSVEEEKLHTLLRNALQTLEEDDRIFLTDFQGTVLSAEDASFVGTQLPDMEAPMKPVLLRDGFRALLVESGDSTGSFSYVLAHRDLGWLRNHDGTLYMWVFLCVVLLCAGMAGVLWVLVKNYARPMRRLMRHIAVPETAAETGSIVSSPSEHFLKIETALQDINKYREEREHFLAESRPELRSAWLNCLISGEASYTVPMPQLDIDFTHPFFQAVILSAQPSRQEEKIILDCFPAQAFTVIPFDSREKERVYLINHASDENAVPDNLRKAGEKLLEAGRGITFGVGILASSADMIPASFRCARRALSSRYFNQKALVCVFDPSESRSEGEDELPQLMSQIYTVIGLIRNKPIEDVDTAIDGIIAQLKENAPPLGHMRSIMLLAASLLSKAVYDVKGKPEAVYGSDLVNVYYHIEDIGDFSSRLKRDCALLSAYLRKESSDSNRSMVEYAIHYIRSMPPAELSTQSIADALSISTGHLSRVFHQETGRKLVDHLLDVKMRYAARLLSEGELSNEQICEMTGYSRLQ
ncbi:MAG: helix-turn-helix domain-containing protein, partial [Clostridia bacterium]|nr:helix-turn-helix domain-containing protein [Clostridia bacterium]